MQKFSKISLFLTAFVLAIVYGQKYSDEFARRKMWPMTAMSSTNSTRCLQECFNNFEFRRNVVVYCDLETPPIDTCAGSALVNHDDKAIVLTFRGSVGDHQVTEENGSLGDKVDFPGGGRVSHYFYNAFIQVWNGGVKDDYLTYKNKYPDYEVWITGHSLGGVMAALGASYLSQMKFADSSKIKLMNFAGPHGGDQAWAERMQTLVPWAYHVVHRYDYVPHIPENKDWQYTHHKFEIWYNNSMAVGDPYVECDDFESPNCSDSVPQSLWTWNDHGNYFEGGDVCRWCQKNPILTTSPTVTL